MRYFEKIDPLEIVLQLCLHAKRNCVITSEDVAGAVFAARGSESSSPPRIYRIESIRGVKLGLIIDEDQHEIDIRVFESVHGRGAVMKAWQAAWDLTLSAKAKDGAQSCIVKDMN